VTAVIRRRVSTTDHPLARPASTEHPNDIMSIASFIQSEFNGNPAVRESNMILLRSAGMFVASVLFMRNFGELLAV
jgi:hypothetical protein